MVYSTAEKQKANFKNWQKNRHILKEDMGVSNMHIKGCST